MNARTSSFRSAHAEIVALNLLASESVSDRFGSVIKSFDAGVISGAELVVSSLSVAAELWTLENDDDAVAACADCAISDAAFSVQSAVAGFVATDEEWAALIAVARGLISNELVVDFLADPARSIDALGGANCTNLVAHGMTQLLIELAGKDILKGHIRVDVNLDGVALLKSEWTFADGASLYLNLRNREARFTTAEGEIWIGHFFRDLIDVKPVVGYIPELASQLPLWKMLTTLAQKKLGIETFATRNSDSLDFPEVSVSGLASVLAEVFEAGRQSVAA